MSSPVKGAIGGAIVGGAAGAAAKKKPKESRAEKVLRGILLGGLIGATAGHIKAEAKFRHKHYSGKGRTQGPRPSSSNPSSVHFRDLDADLAALGFKNKGSIKTKKEVKLSFRKKSMKYHPDRPGGDGKKQARINQAWARVKDSDWFDKLAFFKQYSLKGGINMSKADNVLEKLGQLTAIKKGLKFIDKGVQTIGRKLVGAAKKTKVGKKGLKNKKWADARSKKVKRAVGYGTVAGTAYAGKKTVS